jgi:predicted dehydrogenase
MTLRLAVIGAGDVAQRDYLPELPRLGDAIALQVIAARTEERASAAAERFGARRWTTSFEEAVAADDVDAVVNLTPFPLHETVTHAALAAGKHVYSEKPIARSADAADRIASEARRRGLTVVAAPSILLFPQVVRAREILVEGSIGTIRLARGQALGGIPPWSGYMSDPTPFFVELGGPLADMAVYPLHALTGLLGDAVRVTALSSRARERFTVEDGPFAGKEIQVEVDDNWVIALELANGCLATVEANNVVDETLAPELEILGEHGVLAISLLDVSQPVRILAGGQTREEPVAFERLGGGPDHVLGIAHLAECVAAGTEPVPSLEHARHVLAILDAARSSAETGRAIDVAPPVRL